MVALALSLLLQLFLPASGGITGVVAYSVLAAIVLSFSTVGALIATRQPHNPIGWIMIVAGFGLAATVLTGNYVEISLAQPPGRLPATVWVAWVSQWVWVLGFGPALTFLLLLFPNGRLPSRRWRPVGWLAVAAMVTLGCGVAFMPGPLLDHPQIRNPVGLTLLEGSFLAGEGAPLLFLSLVASTVLSASSMVVRFRRAVGEERQQIKWFALAAAFAAIGWVANSFAYATDDGTVNPLLEVAQFLQLLSFLGIPLAVGIAILRYRLYDIDLIINRTLVYGTLTGMLAAGYVATIMAFQGIGSLVYQVPFRALIGQESALGTVAATLAMAALFNPLRRRIQSFIDRRFYRSKYDARKTLEVFSVKLRDETNLQALEKDLVGVVRETMRPAHVSLWLRPETDSKGRRTT